MMQATHILPTKVYLILYFVSFILADIDMIDSVSPKRHPPSHTGLRVEVGQTEKQRKKKSKIGQTEKREKKRRKIDSVSPKRHHPSHTGLRVEVGHLK